MALPRKGSRKIVVDGLAYRWYIRPRPTHSDWERIESPRLTVAIERDDTPHKTRLILLIPVARPDSGEKPAGVVLPADMAFYIREALQNGWLADQAGSPWTFETKTVPQNTLLK